MPRSRTQKTKAKKEKASPYHAKENADEKTHTDSNQKK
jgi:hypothetical protein